MQEERESEWDDVRQGGENDDKGREIAQSRARRLVIRLSFSNEFSEFARLNKSTF